MLQGVCYVPEVWMSLISIPQLRESGCQVILTEQSSMLRRGQLVLTRGGHGTRCTFLHVLDVRDRSLVVTALPFRGTHPRRVQFAVEQQLVTETETGSVVQTSAHANVE